MKTPTLGAVVLAGIVVVGVITASVAGASGAGASRAEAKRAGARASATSKLAAPSGARVPAFVTAAANRVAAINGDAHPSNAAWVKTTRQTAVSAESTDTVDSNQPVYYVVLHGHFAATKGYLGPGAAVPTGTILTLTVDASTGEVLDNSLSNKTPDFSHTGPPSGLALGP
jgi:hypothetical protein